MLLTVGSITKVAEFLLLLKTEKREVSIETSLFYAPAVRLFQEKQDIQKEITAQYGTR